ncbi:MAG: Gfo/Idh/MocA family protein [Thermoanaerobaculia bacterium]
MAKVGVIGTGWGARVQVPTFRDAGLDVVAIAGHDRDRTAKIASELSLEPAEWQQLIARRDIDLVTITTPPSEHVKMAIAALDANKHVLCEKPTALNATEAEDLVRAAQKHPDRITLVDHELRFVPSWQEARARIESIEPIRYFEARYSSPNWGDRAKPYKWWNDEKQGGGVWGAVGSHLVDAIRYLCGDIREAQALLHTFVRQRPVEGGATRAVTSDDFAAVHLRLASGAVAAMTFSAVSGGPDEPNVMTIHGENGAMRLLGEELLFARRGEPFARVAGGEMAKRPGNSMGGSFGTGTYHLGLALRAALDEGKRDALANAATFRDGLEQQRVLDAARRSSQHDGRWETV